MKVGEILNIDCVEGMRDLVEPGVVDLLIADPPYFKVAKEKWDYEWRTEADYVAWSAMWIDEAAKSLRLGGSCYVFGYFRTLAYLIPVLESAGMKLRQQIVVDKGMQAVSGRATKGYKIFPNVTESILFLVKDPIPFSRQFLKSRQQALGISAREINERLGVKSNGGGMWSIYTGKNVCEQLPTREIWMKLQEILEFDLEYEKVSITFNKELGVTDVWRDIDFYAERGVRIHPTQKPVPLMERLVLASSNRGDLVLDPFMGSGATAVACNNLERRWMGFEVNHGYWQAAQARLASLPHP